MKYFVLSCQGIVNAWRNKMSRNKLPIDIDAQLRELGVLPSDHFEDDLEELRPSISDKKHYNMPVFDEDGEPDF